MDRAFFYAVVVGGVFALCVLLLLNNAPIALFCGALAALLALFRGAVAWS